MKMYDKTLPIGSIVMLNGVEPRLMILGYQCRSMDDSSRVYDYSGCFFPEGYLTPEKVLLFDHDMIEKIVFIGLQNEEQEQFQIKLNEMIESTNKR